MKQYLPVTTLEQVLQYSTHDDQEIPILSSDVYTKHGAIYRPFGRKGCMVPDRVIDRLQIEIICKLLYIEVVKER